MSRQSGVLRRWSAAAALFGGAILSFSAAALAVLAWGILIPWLRGSGPIEFSPSLSHSGLWEEARRSLSLGFWTHDSGFLVGDFGGKEWVEPLVASMVSGEGLSCAGGHREVALEGITNHSPQAGADHGAFWSEWWAKNKDDSQSEWIRRGFERDGVAIALPPNPSDGPALLSILGEKSAGAAKDSNDHSWDDTRFAHPRRARYNAYRWLRDSGFDPVAHALEMKGNEDSIQEEGLLAYREFEKEFRSAVPGRLDFAPTDDWGKGMPLSLRPKIFEPTAQAVIAIALAGSFLLGVLLARWGWRCRHRSAASR